MQSKLIQGLIMLPIVAMMSAVCVFAVRAGEQGNQRPLRTVFSDSQEEEAFLYTDDDILLSEYMGLASTGDANTIDALYAGSFNGNKLSGVTQQVYNGMKILVGHVASGAQSSTRFTYTVDASTLKKYKWTAADLGVSSLYKDSSKTSINRDAAERAVSQVLDELSYDPVLAVRSLIRDCPYEMYWFGNQYHMTKTYVPTVTPSTDTMTMSSIVLKIDLQVSEDYKGADIYSTDATKVKSVRTALDNAAGIISASAGMDDYSKMDYFRQQICSLVSYDYYAGSDTYPGGYGNPWQLIYVFDGDPNTNVVCEGYAKAFQYLCDESGVTSRIPVYMVSGSFRSANGSPQGHLWNVVRMDGSNYLVDLTNCDGNPPHSNLFLAKPVSGSVSQGYVYRSGSTLYTYQYYEDTLRLYSTAELEMFSGWQTINGKKYFIREDGTRQTGWLKQDGNWYFFDADGVMQTGWVRDHAWYYLKEDGTMATGWLNDRGTWYYLKPSGAMAVGWVWDGKNWYYMESSGAMHTGWLLDNGSWYYLGTNGSMSVGWAFDGRNWYYFDPSGAMATGWVNDGGVWYHLSSSGAMDIGWLWDNAWYYLDGSGAMQTGWMPYQGRWYYFDPSGAMQTGWINDGGVWYHLSSSGAMDTGWLWDNAWYYLDGSGAMQTGWLLDGGQWYYLSPSGAMMTGWIELGDSRYFLNENGVWIE